MRKVCYLLFSLLALSGLVECQFQMKNNDVYQLSTDNEYNIWTVVQEDDSIISIWSDPTELSGSHVYIHLNNGKCSSSEFPMYLRYCFAQTNSLVYSLGPLPKNTVIKYNVIPKKLQNSSGKVGLFAQTQQIVPVGESSSLNFYQHTINSFKTIIEESSGVFSIIFTQPDLVLEILVRSQTCNDKQTGYTYSTTNFVIDVMRPCQVEYVIKSSKASYQITSFRTTLKPKLFFIPSEDLQFKQITSVDSYNLRRYASISIDNLQEQFGFSAPMQLFLTLRGINSNDRFSAFVSSTEQFPDISDATTACLKRKICTLRYDISFGNTYRLFFLLFSTLFVEGVDYTLTAAPVAFPPQGLQLINADSRRYMEFDYAKKFPGVGAFYFSFIGTTSGDRASVYINLDGLPFSYSNTYTQKQSESQYQVSKINLTTPKKISLSLIIDSFTSGYQIYYKYLPIFTFSKTETNFKIENPYNTEAGFIRFYSAQIPSYQNVATASVTVRYSGKSAADQINAYFADGNCDLTEYLLQDQNKNCVRYTGYQEFQRTSVISINKPIYFSMQMPMDLLNYQFSVVFNVKCVEGFILTEENTCVSRQVFE